VNKVEILELYMYRQSIKKSILDNYTITLDKADKLGRGEVLNQIIQELGLTKNNTTQEDISNILINMGVSKGIYSGKRDWRGLIRKK